MGSLWKRRSRAPLGVAALVLTMASPLAAEKTDVVILKNGDRITGEVKELNRGRLRFKTDSMGTVYIEWNEIEQVTSEQDFQVEDERGEFFFGSLAAGSENELVVAREESREALDHNEVVRITPIERTFWGKLDGSISLGFSYTQATEITDFSFNSETSYRTRKFLRQLRFDALVSDQSGGKSTTRADLTFSANRFLGHRLFTLALGTLQHNEELGINLRTLGGGGIGKDLILTNRNTLSGTVGLAVSREEVAGGEPAENNLEGLLGLAYSSFTFAEPEVDISTSLLVFPSITESGRVRAELNVSVRRELIKDFFWNLSLLDSYDSKPRVEGAEENDLAVTASLGWSY